MITIQEACEWEIASSWWTQYIWWESGQAACGKYFAWKTKRKYKHYYWSRSIKNKWLKQQSEN